MEYVRGAPYHPHTQGKIERWHRTLKNRILLEHYDLERQVAAFVAHCNMPAITRASTILPKLASSIAERVVALNAVTHWTGAAMAAVTGVSVSSVQRICAAWASAPSGPAVQALRSSTKCATWLAIREGRVLSRRRPSNPSDAKGSCHRQTQVLDLPVSHDRVRAKALGAHEHDLRPPTRLDMDRPRTLVKDRNAPQKQMCAIWFD
jgi:hypothetical protein